LSRSGEPAGSRDAQERLHRRLTLLAACAGLLFLVAVAPAVIAFPKVAWWWLVIGALMPIALVTLLLGHSVLPLAVVEGLWRVVAGVCWMLEFTQFAAWSPADAAALQSWMWALQPAAIMLVGLLLPAWKAIAWTVGLALAPVASAWVFTGEVPPEVVHNTPLALTGVTLVLLLTGVRARLSDAFGAEADAREGERRRTLAHAEAEQQRALARLVHDDVLAVFTAAIQFGGRIPEELRAEARTALTVLAGDAPDARPALPVATEKAAAELSRLVRDSASRAVIDTDASPGSLPPGVVDEVGRAAAEAVRNSIRHGGRDIEVRVRIRAEEGMLEVTVSDEGPGFDPSRVAAERLGVRESILGRMHALDGGSAEVLSAPGRGTEVRLRWHG
jgi:signal transduction histidine kinase